MAKPKKPQRPKAEVPKGFRDYFGNEVTQRGEMLKAITDVYHRYGFDALETSAVETVEALGKFLPDVDRPNEGVFAWQEDSESDKPGDWLALRYDMTAPLARVYAEHRNELPNPIAVTRWGLFGAMRSRVQVVFASSINVTRTLLDLRPWRRTPRFVRCCQTHWKVLEFHVETMSSA